MTDSPNPPTGNSGEIVVVSKEYTYDPNAISDLCKEFCAYGTCEVSLTSPSACGGCCGCLGGCQVAYEESAVT